MMRLRIGVSCLIATAAVVAGFATAGSAAVPHSNSSAAAGLARATAAVQKFQLRPAPAIRVPVTKPIPKGKLIITTGDGLPDALNNQVAFDVAAKLLGWKTKSLNWTETTLSTVNGLMQGIAASSPKPSMVVAGTDSATKVWPIGLQALNAAHIPVVISGTGDPVGNGIVASTLNGADFGKTSGVAMADWIIQNSKGHGNAVIFSLPFLPSVTGVYNFIESTFKHNCPGCQVATDPISPSELVGGTENQAIVAYLQAHPSVKYALNIYAGGGPGIGTALSAAGLNHKVYFVGSTPSVDELAALKSGEIQGALNCSNTSYIGWHEADAAVRYFTHMSEAPNERAGEPIQLLDSSNKKDIPNGVCQVPNNTEQARYFSKLWHLKKK